MKMLWVFLATLLLIGCVNQPTAPTRLPPTPFPTHIATIHHWVAGPVLAQIHEGAGYTEPADAWMVRPSVVIYADGRILTTETTRYSSSNVWLGTIKEMHIPPDDVCSLLTKIEQSGFFDFRESDYVSPDVLDAGNTDIIVNSWLFNSISAYAFESAKNRPTALLTPYNLLSSYKAFATTSYQIERVALLVIERQKSKRLDDAYAWPTMLPPLKKLASGSSSEAVLAGQDMLDAYEFLDNIPFLSFIRDNGVEYQVFLKPLLPFELPTTVEGWSPPSSFEETPKIDLTCDTRMK